MDTVVTAINADHLKLMLCLVLAILSYIKLGQIHDHRTRIQKQERIQINKGKSAIEPLVQKSQDRKIREGNGFVNFNEVDFQGMVVEGREGGMARPITIGELIERNYRRKIEESKAGLFPVQELSEKHEKKQEYEMNIQQREVVEKGQGRMESEPVFETPKCERVYDFNKIRSERTEVSMANSQQSQRIGSIPHANGPIWPHIEQDQSQQAKKKKIKKKTIKTKSKPKRLVNLFRGTSLFSLPRHIQFIPKAHYKK